MSFGFKGKTMNVDNLYLYRVHCKIVSQCENYTINHKAIDQKGFSFNNRLNKLYRFLRISNVHIFSMFWEFE